MKPAGWSPLTGKWLRRGIGGLLVAAALCVLVLAPYYVVVSGGKTLYVWSDSNTVATPIALALVALGGYLIARR